jgi:hypothetical protein
MATGLVVSSEAISFAQTIAIVFARARSDAAGVSFGPRPTLEGRLKTQTDLKRRYPSARVRRLGEVYPNEAGSMAGLAL